VVSVRVLQASDLLFRHVFPVDWEPQSDGYACLEISDTGCGIHPENLDQIFDPFFSTKFTGRGLGLAVVLGAVRTNQGAIAVQSEPDRGSTFRVFWPLSEQKAKPV
jgi:signal transduction histidine kinase